MELKESDTNRVRTNVDVGIEQIIDMEESADEQHDLEDSKKKDKMDGGRQMRRTAMETMGKHRRESPRRGRAKQRNAE